MIQRQKRRPMAHINVVPYIDVMLVLLVIFMVTAPILSQGVVVDLPEQAHAKAVPKKQEPLIVSVDGRGHLYANMAKNPNEVISSKSLQALVAKMLAKTPERLIVVKADRHVVYDKVMQVMTALQVAGANHVGLLTQDPTVSGG